MSDSDNNGFGSSNTLSPGDRYTEVTTTSWFSRIGQSLVGLIIGPILVILGIGLLVWNEDRAVTTARSLTEGLGAVITVDSAQPQPANEGHLIHVAGDAAVTAKLVDPDFGVSLAGLVLQRQVEMLQWREKEESHTDKNVGGSTTTTKTYSYFKDWSSRPINSNEFKRPLDHINPPFAVTARQVTAHDAHLGGFRLDDALLQHLPANDHVLPDAAAIDAAKARLGRAMSISGETLFVGTDSANPQIGDLRITFAAAPVGPVTVVAAQKGSGFAPYQTKAGDTIEEIRPELQTPQQIFKGLANLNTVLTWILRAVGTVLVLVGFSLFFALLSVLADVLPFLGTLVGFGTGLLALSLTIVVVPLTIALAWFAFRPLVSGAVIGAGVIGVVAIRFLWPKKARASR